MNETEIKKTYKNTLKEAERVIKMTLLSDEDFFKKYVEREPHRGGNDMEELTRWFEIVYHAHVSADLPVEEYTDFQRECVERGIYTNWNLDRTDKEISLPLLLGILDKAGVVFERKRYRVDGDVLFPNRMIFQIDRYATKEKRKDEKYQISAKDLLSTDNVMSEEQYKHSIK